jgi:hypothetical protein
MWHKSHMTTSDLVSLFCGTTCRVNKLSGGSQQYAGSGSTTMREVRKLHGAKTVDQPDNCSSKSLKARDPQRATHCWHCVLCRLKPVSVGVCSSDKRNCVCYLLDEPLFVEKQVQTDKGAASLTAIQRVESCGGCNAERSGAEIHAVGVSF